MTDTSTLQRRWMRSLTDIQIGVFPLSSPAAPLLFPLVEGSFNATYRELRTGFAPPLQISAETASVDVAQQWQWLAANAHGPLTAQVGIGFVSGAKGKLFAPLFTAPLGELGSRVGHLQLDAGVKLELNTTLVRLLTRKLQLGTAWLRRGRTASGFNLDAVIDALSEACARTNLEVVRQGRIGLVSRGQNSIYTDLRTHGDTYSDAPLVTQFSQSVEPAKPAQLMDASPLAESLFTPLPASQHQLQVPAAFGEQRSFVLSGPPASGKTDAVVNSLAQAIANGRTTLVVGSPKTLHQLYERTRKAGFEHLFLTVDEGSAANQNAQTVLSQAWDRPVNADEEYLRSCRAAVTSLSTDLDLYRAQVHEPGPNQLSAWQAYTAQLLTAAELDKNELSMAQTLAAEPNFPYQPADRVTAAKLGQELAELDANSVNGLGANPWSLAGATLENIDREVLQSKLRVLEDAILRAHPAVLEIMSSCTDLRTWGVFARWLDLLESGFGRPPVDLPEKERGEIIDSLTELKHSFETLRKNAQPLMEVAAGAYHAGKDIDLLRDARHAEASGSMTRNSRRKAILAELQPYLSAPVSANRVTQLLEDLAVLRIQAETLGSRIENNPVLGLQDFDTLADDAQSRFLSHADTVLTAIRLAQDLPNRHDDLVTLIPIARDGGALGKQVREIAAGFAGIMECLQSTSQDLEKWADALPPLARYLQVRKVWSAALSTHDSTLDDMVAYRAITPRLKAAGLELLGSWVGSGRLVGKSIQGVLEHALSIAAVSERERALSQNGFQASAQQAQVERLAFSAAELRRGIVNQIISRAGIFAQRADKDTLRRFGAKLRRDDFSINSALGEDLEGILTRTPIVGLTPTQVAEYLKVPAVGVLFDGVIILEAADLVEGAVIKALALATHVMFVATLPAPLTYARGKAKSAYAQALSAGLPECRFMLRYGTNISDAPAFFTSLLAPKVTTWVPVGDSSAPAHILELPATSEALPFTLNNELPGFTTGNVSRKWCESAGNLLLNLAYQNPRSTLKAVTHTNEAAAGIRWYLQMLANRVGEPLPPIEVVCLGQAPGNCAADAQVFFCGADASPRPTKNGVTLDFSIAMIRALLSVNRRVFFVLDRNLNRHALPPLLQDILAGVEQPATVLNAGAHQADEGGVSNIVTDYLARIFTKAGLEVRVFTGKHPYRADLAVRGDKKAPWLALTLDTPTRSTLQNTWDREVGIGQFLHEECGFGAVHHLFLTDLMGDIDEVTRQVVSLALDLAFPGDILENSIASDDVVESASLRHTKTGVKDLFEDPGRAAWQVPARLRHSPAKPSAAVPPGSRASAKNAATQVETGVLNQVSVTQRLQENARIEDMPPEHLRKTRSTVPVVSDMPPEAFTHLHRDEIAVPNAPSLADELGAMGASWVAEMASIDTSQTGKITQPGLTSFAPLFASETAPDQHINTPSQAVNHNEVPKPAVRESAAKAPLPETEAPPRVAVSLPRKQPKTPDLPQFKTPQTAEKQLPAPGEHRSQVEPLVPQGKPRTNLGDKDILDNLNDPGAAAEISRALDDILRTEGPVGSARLAKLVADAYGMQRLHPKRRDRILSLLSPQGVRVSTSFGDFVWPENLEPRDYRAFRTGSIYGQRTITDICDEEFNNALEWVIATQSPLEDEASEAVCRVLDLTPARTKIRDRMQLALTRLEQSGRLVLKNGSYHLE